MCNMSSGCFLEFSSCHLLYELLKRLFWCLTWFKLWFTRAAVHSKDMSVSYRQTGPGQHQAACSDESNQIPQSNYGAYSSLPPSDAAGPLFTCLWVAFNSNRGLFLSLLLSFYLCVSSAHQFSLLVFAALFLPTQLESTSSVDSLAWRQAGFLRGGWLAGSFIQAKKGGLGSL